MTVPLPQQILLLGVVLHQLGQRGKLLAPVQVIVVTRVLDLDVGHLIIPPVQGKKKTRSESLCLFKFIKTEVNPLQQDTR